MSHGICAKSYNEINKCWPKYNQPRRLARADCIVGIGDAELLGVELAQEFFGGFYQLGIDAFQHIGGEVIYFHVGIQLLVFKCFAVLVKGSNLRNTEDDGRVSGLNSWRMGTAT